jgi:hypothetical protein
MWSCWSMADVLALMGLSTACACVLLFLRSWLRMMERG